MTELPKLPLGPGPTPHGEWAALHLRVDLKGHLIVLPVAHVSFGGARVSSIDLSAKS